ncbi:extracellular solute-binding protein [Vibrio agarivorans]|uniref:Extracellular solute-binding protein n=1 Tax=Vibrio agarivorans TaxID=153622 RepID=A0ABT7Y0G2_9VIBR|nr:extracellular solute-binding protein [Vibrio agarivorans]MDN2481506.1 extracellular solute-binding protein [Vibrio agarivorans]
MTSDKNDSVVIYTSVDQVFSEPILKEFENKTGIKVKALYDVEASKTVGLVNKLLAEKKNPQADVFWNSEVSRTIQLMNQDIFAPYKSIHWDKYPKEAKNENYYWTGFASRARVLIYNTDLLSESELPKSMFELTQPEWKGRVSMAYPLFGTTATHISSLYATIGKEATESYLKELHDNDVMIVDGNARTRDLVVEGVVPIAFTDTDDANVAIQQGKPVDTLYFDKEGIGTLLIPNTVSLVKNSPNSVAGKHLIDYLLSAKTEEMLAYGESAQMPLQSGVKKPEFIPDIADITAMNVDYEQAATYIEESAEFSKKLFIR